MHTPTIPGRGLAILVGLAFLVASLSALFGEDLTNWHAWTMKHYEVLAILFGAIASGLLCRYAKRARMWIACAAFALLFVATTGLVVYKSLGRQAAATATQSMSAEDSNKLIADKMGDLATTRQRLTDADAQVDYEQKGRPDRSGKPTVKPGCGKHCEDWKRRAAEVRSRVQILEQEIRSIGPRQVAAPEAENFAQLMGIFGSSTTKVKALAVLLVPVLWTLALEAGARLPASSTRFREIIGRSPIAPRLRLPATTFPKRSGCWQTLKAQKAILLRVGNPSVCRELCRQT